MTQHQTDAKYYQHYIHYLFVTAELICYTIQHKELSSVLLRLVRMSLTLSVLISIQRNLLLHLVDRRQGMFLSPSQTTTTLTRSYFFRLVAFTIQECIQKFLD